MLLEDLARGQYGRLQIGRISYQVEIKKTHYSQGDPVNTVSATGMMIGGGVPSPVKKKQQQN